MTVTPKYGCSFPDERTELIPDQDSRLAMQGMLETIVDQRQEIEVLKKALNMALAYISEDARKELSLVASAICNSKFNDAENQIYKDAAGWLVLEGK
jgi:hypothetical protein